jgi:glycogen(starch) synthase
MVRTLMLGWEFPPFISGGLGTACHGLTKAMNRLGIEVVFVLPKATGTQPRVQSEAPHRASGAARRSTQEEGFTHLTFRVVPSRLSNPYQTPASGRAAYRHSAVPSPDEADVRASRPPLRIIGTGVEEGYEGDLIAKVEEYANRCARLARGETFDIIHAHDWMTYSAGMAIAARSGRPLVVHVHSTEFDRSGEHVHQAVYDIERRGMHAATAVICVSGRTREIVIDRYGVPPGRVHVVYNGIELEETPPQPAQVRRSEKVVLFLGRITMQKGPEFFIRAAARVLEKLDDVMFIVAGTGDMLPQTVEQVAQMGLGHKVLFAGFLRGTDVERAFRMADVYVMPSVSEPFGLTALEAIRYGVPVVISKSSGVAEVLQGSALKVDFWDIDKMADMIVTVLARPEVAESLRRQGASEIRRLSWDESARRCLAVYEESLRAADGRRDGRDNERADGHARGVPAAPWVPVGG